jgi:hypothetical protein
MIYTKTWHRTFLLIHLTLSSKQIWYLNNLFLTLALQIYIDIISHGTVLLFWMSWFQLKAVADMNQRDLQSKMEQEERRVSFCISKDNPAIILRSSFLNCIFVIFS